MVAVGHNVLTLFNKRRPCLEEMAPLTLLLSSNLISLLASWQLVPKDADCCILTTLWYYTMNPATNGSSQGTITNMPLLRGSGTGAAAAAMVGVRLPGQKVPLEARRLFQTKDHTILSNLSTLVESSCTIKCTVIKQPPW